ncbi:S8 family peptidase [Streptomyces sparsus]
MKRTARIRTALGAGLAALAVMGTTLATANAAEPGATGEIRGAGIGRSISGEYIVVLKDTAGKAGSGNRERRLRDRVSSLTGRHGGAVERTYTTALEGFSVKASARQARRLAADPAVAYVEPNRVETGDDTQTDPVWGLDRIDQRDLPLNQSYAYAGTAANVTAYVVDSGVRIGHSEFGGRARYGYNFVDGNTTASDCHGHGTHTAGTVGGATYGVAKGVKIVAVKVLNCNNSGTTANVLAGYDWVAKNAVKPAVANVSIGGSASDAKDEAVRRMVEAGVTVAVSAGNKATDACTQSPAREPKVITVASTASDDTRSSFSNYGSCVDLFAPGTSVVSASHASDTGSATKSGTSMSAPHVTGAAALYVSANPTATPAAVTEALLDRTTGGKVTSPGTGSPNKLLFSGP